MLKRGRARRDTHNTSTRHNRKRTGSNNSGIATETNIRSELPANHEGATERRFEQITIDAPRLKTVTFSPGVRVGNLLFISGQVSIDPNGNIVGRGDFSAQCKQVFHNIQLVLNKAGASFSDIVKLNAYMTDLRNYATYARIRGEYFQGHYPASTVVGNAALIHEGLMLEVEGIAVLQ